MPRLPGGMGRRHQPGRDCHLIEVVKLTMLSADPDDMDTMATKTLMVLVDDIDGTEGAQPTTFGLAGRVYEIDLCPENLEMLEQALAPFLCAARQVAVRAWIPLQRNGGASGLSREELQAIREWATTQGIDIGDRGRVARTVIDAYQGRPATHHHP
jgi:hypothetical protein